MYKIVKTSLRDHILRVPKMYIGHDLDTNGLHFLIALVIRSAVIPESLNKCSTIIVTIEQTGEISLTDDGVGLSVKLVSIDESIEMPAIEHILSGFMPSHPSIHHYERFGFLIELGAVLSAVSNHLKIETITDGQLYTVSCSQGKITKPLEKVGEASQRGTRITFLPDSDVFSHSTFDNTKLTESLSQLAREYPEVKFTFEDKRTL